MPETRLMEACFPADPARLKILRGMVEVAAMQAGCSEGVASQIVLAVNDLWTWQMDASIDLEDQTHEIFWRQLLRWLVEGSPNPVRGSAVVDRVEPGEGVELRAQVEDSAFSAVNGAVVSMEVTGPAGEELTGSLDWAVDRDGAPTTDGELSPADATEDWKPSAAS